VLFVKEFEEVIVKHPAKRGFSPIVVVIRVKGNFCPRLRRHSKVISVDNIETNKLDTVVDKMLTRIKGFVVKFRH